jgi:hypothetical protein
MDKLAELSKKASASLELRFKGMKDDSSNPDY